MNTDLHETMDAVAATMPGLAAADVLARGRRYRTRRRMWLTAGGVASAAAGLAVLSVQPVAPDAGRQYAGPVATATSAAPTPSSAVPALDPAQRFTKGREEPLSGAYVTTITDRALPAAYPDEPILRIVRDPGVAVLPPYPSNVDPERVRIAGVDVRMSPDEKVFGVYQADWIRDGSRYILEWDGLGPPYEISQSDVRWLITASATGRW